MTPEDNQQLISVALRLIGPKESALMIDLLDHTLNHRVAAHPRPDILRLVKAGEHGTAFNSLALYLHRCTRELAGCESAARRAVWIRLLLNLREQLDSARTTATPDAAPAASDAQPAGQASIDDAIVRAYQISVGRSPAQAEIDIWKANFANGLPFHEFFLGIQSGDEGRAHVLRQTVLAELGDGEYVQTAYAIVLGRGAGAWEIDHWLTQLERGGVTRPGLLTALMETAKNVFGSLADAAPHDGLSCQIMGTGKTLTASQWATQAQAQCDATPRPADTRYLNRFHVEGEPRLLVSALASVYRGGEFIEQFMENITGQDGFDEFCELVIVDADSPENEYETIRRYLDRHANIKYIRCNYRLGIYDAWNVAANAARGKYLTNTNMDDLRRHDSLMLQAATLENLPHVDVVYQDLFYTFDPKLSFEAIAAFGHETALPVITPHNMFRFNSPHNAPMWRKSLHEEIGNFDTRYKSAGDYEFWMRCLAAGKNFFKINDPHVVYYQNPKGLSTRPDTRGVIEAMEVTKTHWRKLVPAEVVMPRRDYLKALCLAAPDFLGNSSSGRYGLAQQALRNLARHDKYRNSLGAEK